MLFPWALKQRYAIMLLFSNPDFLYRWGRVRVGKTSSMCREGSTRVPQCRCPIKRIQWVPHQTSWINQVIINLRLLPSLSWLFELRRSHNFMEVRLVLPFGLTDWVCLMSDFLLMCLTSFHNSLCIIHRVTTVSSPKNAPTFRWYPQASHKLPNILEIVGLSFVLFYFNILFIIGFYIVLCH